MSISSTDYQSPNSFEISRTYNPSWSLVENLVYYEQVIDPSVTGWFYLYDHSLFYEVLKTAQKDITGDCCEIGVAFGKSAIAISNYRQPGENFYIYDIFEDPQWENIARGNITKYGTIGGVEFRVGDSTKLTPDDLNFKQPLKFLHIDGSHEHNAVLKDLENFSSKMVDKAVIVVDDFNDAEFPGVRSGLFEFLLSNRDQWVMFAIGSNKAFLCRKEHHNYFILSVLNGLETAQAKNKIPYNFNLREVINHNVLLVASRGSQNAKYVKENLNKTLLYTST